MTILETCLDIHNVVVEKFPSAHSEIQLDRYVKGSVYMEITPSEKFPSFTFSFNSAVFVEELSSGLEELLLSVREAETCTKLGDPMDPVDVFSLKRISTDIPLIGWQKFRRASYEASGKSCTKAIENYLANPGDLSTLTHLGLAPPQVEDGGTESDYFYFRKVFADIPNMPDERRQPVRDNFQKLFPKVYSVLVQEGREKQGEERKPREEEPLRRDRLEAKDKAPSQEVPGAGADGIAGCVVSRLEQSKGSFSGGSGSTGWPNSKTLFALVLTVVNIACEAMKSSFIPTIGCNAALRLFSIACHYKNVGIVVREVAALVILVAAATFAIIIASTIAIGSVSMGFLTIGRCVVIGLDVVPELIQAFQQHEKP